MEDSIMDIKSQFSPMLEAVYHATQSISAELLVLLVAYHLVLSTCV